MTPDTTVYMIAGFIVILGGILGYILSLILRTRRVKRILELIQLEEKD